MPPLVSIIIPCYNHAHFLPKAIRSVIDQSYNNTELIVVDDGSIDDTKQVCLYFQQVKYVYQANAGLSAARNGGLKVAKGAFVIFLDADDWLYPNAIDFHLPYLLRNPDIAFVSGAFDVVYVEKKIISERVQVVMNNHYLELLRGNYIGLPASVLYRKSVLEEFDFDLSAPDSCGDYDLYLRIARKYPILHQHEQKVAAYCIHSSNMSSNSAMMLTSVLKVLKRHKKHLITIEEKKAYAAGSGNWRNHYCIEIYNRIKNGANPNSKEIKALLYKPKLFLNLIFLDKYPSIKKTLKKLILLFRVDLR